MIHAALREKFICTATRGNLNNHIGVPLTLLGMTAKTEMAVVEMGANHSVEIDLLCKSRECLTYGFITNFGGCPSIWEGFGSLEGGIQAKTKMYRDLAARDKIDIW
ncbi:MAG: Mur ligase family protein [Flavobacteriaceae bacterium]|nr:Mur ligase family protein [Flavobacteriaceae bacterium]